MERDQPLTPPYAQPRPSTQALTHGGPPAYCHRTQPPSEQQKNGPFGPFQMTLQSVPLWSKIVPSR